MTRKKFMSKTKDAIFTNWKTTVPGLIAAIATPIVTTPGHFGFSDTVVNAAGFAMAIGVGLAAIAAKSHDKSGTPDGPA